MIEKDIRRRIEKRLGQAFSGGGVDSTLNIWQTVYGDMMTNLLLFFLMMFCLNMVGQTHLQMVAETFRQSLEGKPVHGLEKPDPHAPAAKAENLNDFFRKFAEREENVQVIEGGEGIRLRMPEPVLFDPGEAELRAGAKILLLEFAEGLKTLPNVLVVEGHTDNVPLRKGNPFKSNWELSEARAESVVNYLTQQAGVPARRLAVAGFGEYWPFVPNDSDLNRALNRRIELLVIQNEK